PDLGELLSFGEVVGEDDRRHQLVAPPGGLLDADEVLVPAQQPAAGARRQLDRGVDCGEEWEPIPGGAGGGDVAADGPGVSDLGRADRPRRLGEGAWTFLLDPAPSHSRADARRAEIC